MGEDERAKARLLEEHLPLGAARRRWLGRRLAMDGGRDCHLATRLAQEHRASAHWVRVLGRRVEQGREPARAGRPRTPQAERERVRALVEEQLRAQGEVGWRPVLEAIRRAGERASVMLVQQETSAVKREGRVRERRALEAAREGHEVLVRDAVWAQDALHAGRLSDRGEVQAEVATDRGSGATVIAAVGRPARAEDLVEHFERASRQRGGPPLVWQSDRGSANRSAQMARHLDERRVIHLCSRVHTPTDNPVAENRNRELEDESGLGCGAQLASLAEGQGRLEEARRRLDEQRLRASRGYRTAAQVDRDLVRADTLVDRAAFYAEARTAMAQAVLGLSEVDEIAKAEPGAVWATLERHGLARARRGVQRVPCPRLPPVAPGASG